MVFGYFLVNLHQVKYTSFLGNKANIRAWRFSSRGNVERGYSFPWVIAQRTTLWEKKLIAMLNDAYG